MLTALQDHMKGEVVCPKIANFFGFQENIFGGPARLRFGSETRVTMSDPQYPTRRDPGGQGLESVVQNAPHLDRASVSDAVLGGKGGGGLGPVLILITGCLGHPLATIVLGRCSF